MFKEPIAINNLHEYLLKDYLDLLAVSIKECTGKNNGKFLDYIDVCNIIIEHHNGYRKHSGSGNFYDFLAIIPTNMSVMTAGFLAGMETKRNAKDLRTTRYILTEYAHDLVEQLDKIEVVNE